MEWKGRGGGETSPFFSHATKKVSGWIIIISIACCLRCAIVFFKHLTLKRELFHSTGCRARWQTVVAKLLVWKCGNKLEMILADWIWRWANDFGLFFPFALSYFVVPPHIPSDPSMCMYIYLVSIEKGVGVSEGSIGAGERERENGRMEEEEVIEPHK